MNIFCLFDVAVNDGRFALRKYFYYFIILVPYLLLTTFLHLFYFRDGRLVLPMRFGFNYSYTLLGVLRSLNITSCPTAKTFHTRNWVMKTRKPKDFRT